MDDYYTIADISSEEEGDFIEYLKLLISGIDADLDSTALGITKLVISQGLNSLSEKQAYVFETFVLKEYSQKYCTRCSTEIPWSEMYGAVFEDGMCGYCQYTWEKMKDE
jgi:hypothetical protein